MKQTTGITIEALGEKYLGLPTTVGQSTTEAFEPILAKIWGLVGGWSEKLLSGVAKEVLIKSVAQSIATYPMNCFLLSSTTRKKITLATSNFWWGVTWIAKPSTGEGGRNSHYRNVLVAWGSGI